MIEAIAATVAAMIIIGILITIGVWVLLLCGLVYLLYWLWKEGHERLALGILVAAIVAIVVYAMVYA